MPRGNKKPEYLSASSENSKVKNGNGITDVTKELWQAAVNLRGSIEPADYKRYVLPVIFLRFLSLRYEKRRRELVLICLWSSKKLSICKSSKSEMRSAVLMTTTNSNRSR